MAEHDLKELLDPVIQIAYQAGKVIMEVYDAGFSVEKKSDHTPVTEADMAANNVIESSLKELTPHLPILTEEAKPMPYSERKKWARYWLIDPLDGTREFIKRNGEFTVNIALIDGDESVMGVVYAPVLGVIYYAAKGQGAFKQESTNEPKAIHVNDNCSGKTVVTCGRSHPTEQVINFLENLGEHEIVRVGSALKSCMVAEGKADLYPRLGPTSEWDTAAAQCVVEEAGGAITDTNMQRLRYNTKDDLLNPDFFVAGDLSIKWNDYL
ncbi:MAG: 3'(2'),5'-bisphosphate nucleotidase CysQ [Gammaproteobacteria bacterium]|nr:3'(2'),5'-bisphosphate nucleotidase CysQ [Gammaproteobacteria bacterium]